MDASNFPASSSGYIVVGNCSGRHVFKIQELVGLKSKHGLKLVDWDGMFIFFLFFATRHPTNREP